MLTVIQLGIARLYTISHCMHDHTGTCQMIYIISILKQWRYVTVHKVSQWRSLKIHKAPTTHQCNQGTTFHATDTNGDLPRNAGNDCIMLHPTVTRRDFSGNFPATLGGLVAFMDTWYLPKWEHNEDKALKDLVKLSAKGEGSVILCNIPNISIYR